MAETVFLLIFTLCILAPVSVLILFQCLDSSLPKGVRKIEFDFLKLFRINLELDPRIRDSPVKKKD